VNKPSEVPILKAGAAIPGAPRNRPRDRYRPRQSGSHSPARTTFNSTRTEAVPSRAFMVPTFRKGLRTHRAGNPLESERVCVEWRVQHDKQHVRR